MTGEFDLIRRYLAPLAEAAPGALGLRDDAALLTSDPGDELVVTADAMISGVHFLPEDPPDTVARKLLRVNLSDLAAMGARPLGYLLTVAWPRPVDESWVADFARGLAEDQRVFRTSLLGGDTTATTGPLVLSLTALGSVAAGHALRRSGAREGDLIYVSGTIGDGALGLMACRGDGLAVTKDERAYLADRYRLPRPRLALGQALTQSGLANGAIDISDGLVADLGHVLEASSLAGVVETAAIPLSPAARSALAADSALLEAVLTGGDDYELLFAVSPGRSGEIADLAARLDLPLTQIGHLTAGQGLSVRDSEGREIALPSGGWTHF